MSVLGHYSAGDENARMALDRNRVEWVRTCELLDRWLPPPPATVIDVGGGPGRQARHLLDLGYQVTLYDLVPKHVEQAAARGVPAEAAEAALPADQHDAEDLHPAIQAGLRDLSPCAPGSAGG